MAKTPSNMLPLGTKLPVFQLPDPSGKVYEVQSLLGPKGLLVMFICNHCPYVKHLADDLAATAREFMPQGVGMVAINANDVEKYPDDRPELMEVEARQRGYAFPYLYDQTQEVARSFDAACTPEFYLFDRDGRLSYRGQFDDSRPGNGVPVTGQDLRAALIAQISGGPISSDQKPSIGCNIKWRIKG